MQTRLELYQLVAPLVGLGIWEHNTGTGETYVNSIIYQIFEVPPGSTVSPEQLFSLYPDPDRVRQLYHEVVTTGGQSMADLEIATATGNTKWVRLRMRASFADGQALSVYGTLEDITSQVNFMRIVQEREQQLSQAFRYAPIGMALVSLSGTWMKVNNSVCQLLGYTEAQLLEITFQDITHPEDLDSDLQQLQQLVSGVIETYSMEKRYFHKDGHIVWALLNVSLVRSGTGEPLYFVSQIKDITELKRSTEIIRAQNSRLLNFAHIVSHNLRSHTGNIKMLTDMVVAESDRAEQLKQINMLATAAGNLLETLSELNDVVSIHDNGLEHRESLDLWKEIQRVLTILSPSIQESGADIEIAIPEGTAVRFNPAYLESVFINLISNSIKYRHPSRAPRIHITVSQTVELIVVKVTDNGIGIDMPLHGHKLFGMYKTFHGNKDARGMGLFLVKNQVEAMGGRIFAESRPGEGSSFTMEITRLS
jgi:PAS domain S-box-containing protein